MTEPTSELDDFAAFNQEFSAESDRAIVVLTAAKLDYLLLCVLQKHLVPDTATNDEFFENQGPGSTFSNKIALAFRLGLISQDMTQRLTLIRRIRNDFAHEITGSSLEAGSHRDRVLALAAPYRKIPAFQWFQDTYFKGVSRSRADYMTVAGILIIRLAQLMDSIEPVDQTKCWPVISPETRDWKPEPEHAGGV